MFADKKRNITCCFTGHRDMPAGEAEQVRRWLKAVVLNLYQSHGVRYFGAGGALGFDTLAAETVLELRAASNPGPALSGAGGAVGAGGTAALSGHSGAGGQGGLYRAPLCAGLFPCAQPALGGPRRMVYRLFDPGPGRSSLYRGQCKKPGPQSGLLAPDGHGNIFSFPLTELWEYAILKSL